MITIASAAIIGYDQKVYSVPPPGRHHNIIRLMRDLGHPKPIKGEQGFLLSNGMFVDRETAKPIARVARQLLPRASESKYLFSEDVW